MKKLRLYILLPLFASIFVMCSAEDDNLVAEQQTAIERFLNSYDDHEIINNSIYRLAVPREGNYNRRNVIEKGDSVYFDFAGYQFTSSRVEPAFYSNRDWVVEGLKEAGLNPIYWKQDREEIRLGDSKLIKAIEIGLEGCTEGDSVRLFLTTDLAYGANYVSTLPINSAVEYVIWVEEVKKQ